MAIASRKPTSNVRTQPNLPKVQPDSYKSIIVDDKSTPINSLLAYIAGSIWTVDYFSQVVSRDNDLREIDPGQSDILQQYQRTIGLEIRVESTPATSYDSETGLTTVHGSGLLYPFMTPNVSDYFVSDMANSEKAIFRITQVDRKTFNRDSVFAIEYDLVGFVSAQPVIYQSLIDKTIRSYHFSRDRLIDGLQPTIKTEEFQKVVNLKTAYSNLASHYFKSFYDHRYQTLVLPGQSYAIYDSFLLSYLLKIVETTDAPEIRSIRQLPTDGDRFFEQTQFWDMMLNKNYQARTQCNNVMGLVSKLIFNFNTFIHGAMYTNIDYFIYPNNPDLSTSVAGENEYKVLSFETIIDTTPYKGGLTTAISNQYVTATKVYELIKEILTDTTYVLSSDFYNETTNMSVLEIITKDYMKNSSIDLDMLYALLAQYPNWKRLEQFYYGPILLTLIKEADRAQYT